MKFPSENFKGKPEHITESSGEYREYVQNRAEQSSKPKVFGKFEIDSLIWQRSLLQRFIQYNTEDPTSEGEKNVEDQREIIRETIDRLRKIIRDLKEDQLLYLAKELAKKSEILLLLGITNHEKSIEEIANKLAQGGLEDEIIEKIIITHIESHFQEERSFKELALVIVAEYKGIIQKYIEEGYLPVSLERVTERLSDIKFYLEDYTGAVSNMRAGVTHPESRTIIVSSQQPDMYRQIVFHELTHQIAGRTILKRHGPKGVIDIIHQRNGLTFDGRKAKGFSISTNRFFLWLDEAVTEDIAQYLMQGEEGSEDEGSYFLYRNMLHEFYDKGLSRAIVYAAYFENYDPELLHGERVLAWKDVMKKFKEIHPGGLNTLK